MNPFSSKHKNSQTKPYERIKIKSKYFGQYEPDLFIASRSKSKSPSTQKDDANNFISKKFYLNPLQTQSHAKNKQIQAQSNNINPQTTKTSLYFNSGKDCNQLKTSEIPIDKIKMSVNKSDQNEKLQDKQEDSFRQNVNQIPTKNSSLKQDLKANTLSLKLEKKHNNQTGLCQGDNWSNSIFHPEKVSETLHPTEINNFVISEQNEEILNQIFQMNDSQQNILKIMHSRQYTTMGNQKIVMKTQIIYQSGAKFLSQSSKSRKSLAQNYFSMHLGVEQSNQVKTYEMPLAKASTNMMSKTFQNKQSKSSSSKILSNQLTSKRPLITEHLNSQRCQKPELTKQKMSLQTKNQQTNAFVPRCNLFGTCRQETSRQLQRSNYFTQISVEGRDRVTSCNSNQSKTSSRPKVIFNYLSPSQKHTGEKENETSILFKSQNQHLKNKGKAPVKIDIKPQIQTKQSEGLKTQVFRKNSSKVINRDLRSYTEGIIEKQRSRSVPQFTVDNIVFPQKSKPKLLQKIQQLETEKKSQTKNTFISTGYGPSYYKSQKIMPKITQTQTLPTQTSYQTAQSYYFPNFDSLNMIKSQYRKNQVQTNTNEFKKDLVCPVQKARTQRTKSLCEKIFVTLKNGNS